MKAREQSAGIQETLPLRLRVFEKFPDRPTMARLHKVPSDFSLPKVTDYIFTFALIVNNRKVLPCVGYIQKIQFTEHKISLYQSIADWNTLVIILESTCTKLYRIIERKKRKTSIDFKALWENG